jgi:hypothetical protein
MQMKISMFATSAIQRLRVKGEANQLIRFLSAAISRKP